MKIFVSSLISGFEPFRAAAREATRTLGHEPIMAEELLAQPNSPQVACLTELRQADLVVLLLGGRYGYVQGSSAVAPTHEEYLAARGAKPILLFVQEGVEREPRQEAFVNEVQGWQGGLFREGFRTPDELRERLIRALHHYEIAHATRPMDPVALVEAAIAMAREASGRRQGNGPALNLVVVGENSRTILRPAELEARDLADDLQQQAQFGPQRLFDKARGVETTIEGNALSLTQDSGCRVQLTEHGAVSVRLPLEAPEGRRSGFGLFAIIEERVVAGLAGAIAYADWVLHRVDPTQQITHVGVAASIEASEHLGWRTQAEQDASPNSGSMRMGGTDDSPPVAVDRLRAALRFDASQLAEDLMVPLRRQRKGQLR